jgi:sugar phosphate permease
MSMRCSFVGQGAVSIGVSLILLCLFSDRPQDYTRLARPTHIRAKATEF